MPSGNLTVRCQKSFWLATSTGRPTPSNPRRSTSSRVRRTPTEPGVTPRESHAHGPKLAGSGQTRVREAGTKPQAVTMTGTRGRPRGNTSTLRQRELLRLLAEGVPWRQAAKQARVSGDTVLGLLDRADFAAVAKAVIEERIAVTVIVQPAPIQAAA